MNPNRGKLFYLFMNQKVTFSPPLYLSSLQFKSIPHAKDKNDTTAPGM